MRHKGLVAAASAAALFFLAFSFSCQQFFTTTLAAPLARTGYVIPSTITAEEAAAMLPGASPELAAALVTPLLAAAKAAEPGTDAYNKAATVLLEAAVTSSGVGGALAAALSALPSGEEGESNVDLSAALAGFDAVSLTTDAKEALKLLADHPPADMSADTAIAAAAALIADACNDAGTTLSALTGGSTEALPEGIDQESLEAAVKLLTKAAEIDPSNPLAGLLGTMPEL